MMDSEARTTGMGLWTDANEMLEASQHLMNVKRLAFSQPLYYLLCHSLELTFKAYIRSKGASLTSLRTIGHDLVVAKEWAVSAGIEAHAKIDPTEHDAIALINGYYKRKEFEYRVTGLKQYPPSDGLVNLIQRLLQGIRQTCLDSLL